MDVFPVRTKKVIMLEGKPSSPQFTVFLKCIINIRMLISFIEVVFHDVNV